MEKSNTKRILTSMILFSLIMSLLFVRIWYIQIICHDELKTMAESQYNMAIVGIDSRGAVLDRNMKPLTGGTKEYYYVIPKKHINDETESTIDSLEGRLLTANNSEYFVYRTEKFNSLIAKELKEKYGVYIFETESRYSDQQIACHLLGYLNKDEQRGVSGLELMYQDTLAPSQESLRIWADAAGKIIKGYAPDLTSSKTETFLKENSLVTTLDRRIQYVCEKALKESGKSGAVVVLDSDTGEIISWASSPTFNPNNVEDYLNEDGDRLLDKVCQGTYAPGSVFKIVTAAAALELQVADIHTEFVCNGEVTVEGVSITCSTCGEDGHGSIDMKTAMAQSCNCYFAQLGRITGYGNIIEMALKMGLGQTCFENYPFEAKGSVPSIETSGPWDTTNLSVGQGELLVTPLQMARMTNIIATGGLLIKPKLILEEESVDYERVLSKKTAEEIDEMLKEVMVSGTGKGQWQLPVKGKTGTAEAVSSGENINNCWFSGYFTASKKTYVVTVLIEDGSSGASTAIPVFRSVYNFLADNL